MCVNTQLCWCRSSRPVGLGLSTPGPVHTRAIWGGCNTLATCTVADNAAPVAICVPVHLHSLFMLTGRHCRRLWPPALQQQKTPQQHQKTAAAARARTPAAAARQEQSARLRRRQRPQAATASSSPSRAPQQLAAAAATRTLLLPWTPSTRQQQLQS